MDAPASGSNPQLLQPELCCKHSPVLAALPPFGKGGGAAPLGKLFAVRPGQQPVVVPARDGQAEQG